VTPHEEPSFVLVDLTSTIRSLASGDKKQRALILRWKKTGELELKCDGKWTQHEKRAAIEKIMETTNAVIQSVPLNTKSPREVAIADDLEQKILLLFTSLNTEALPCLKDVH
jgi:hypothetical protein